MTASKPTPPDNPPSASAASDSGDLLERLSRRASALKAEQERQKQDAAADAQRLERALWARIQAVYRYFRKLKDNLEVLSPELTADYELPEIGKLKGLRQGGYGLHSPDPIEKSSEFTFQYLYTDESEHKIEMTDRAAATQYKELLRRYRLAFTVKDLTAGSVFRVKGRVPVSFTFSAAPERGQIKLVIRNLENLGPTTNFFDLERVNRELADEITKCVLHESNRLRQLTGDDLSKTGLLRIRDQLQRHREEQEQLADAEPRGPRTLRWGLRRRGADDGDD